MSVPNAMRTQRSVSPIQRLKRTFGEGPDRQFFYQLYHNETWDHSGDSGPAEAEYDADPYETIYRIWTDSSVEPMEFLSPRSQKRRDGGMFARVGIPKHLPAWLCQADIDYVVEQFKVSGFRGYDASFC